MSSSAAASCGTFRGPTTRSGASQRIECVLPDDPEPIIKEHMHRTWLECSNEASALIEEQLRDGFVEV